MRYFSLLILLIPFLALAQNGVIIGYVPFFWNGTAYEIDYSKLDIAIYGGQTDIPTSSPFWDASDLASDGYMQDYIDSAHANGNKILLTSLSGYPVQDGVENMIASDANIQTFVDTVCATALHYGFDGVEIDWEFPTGNAEEFGVLLGKFRRKLDTWNPPGILTAAVYYEFLTAAYIADSLSHCDYILPMTYTMWQGLGDGMISGFDTPLNLPNSYGTYKGGYLKAPEVFPSYTSRGISKSKICVGISFEGTVFYDYNTLNVDFEGGWGTWAFTSTVTNCPAGGYADIPASGRVHDAQAVANYVVSGGDIYVFHDTATVRQITEFAVDSGYAGVFIWDVPAGYDSILGDELLSVISSTMENHDSGLPAATERKRLFFRK